MDFQETIAAARDAITVKRVYGDPYERDGVTVIPAATVSGGAGGGSGDDAKGGSGGGGGFGLGARPVGAYVIDNGTVRWEPAIDIARIVGQTMLAASVIAVVWALRRR
jgi:uncharacterized spore protein YtfJ